MDKFLFLVVLKKYNIGNGFALLWLSLSFMEYGEEFKECNQLLLFTYHNFIRILLIKGEGIIIIVMLGNMYLRIYLG